MIPSPLSSVLADAAAGRFPPVDGACEVLAPDPHGTWAIVAFTGHAYVLGDVDPVALAARMPAGDPGGFGAANDPSVVLWVLAQFDGLTSGVLDAVLVADLDHHRHRLADDAAAVGTLDVVELGAGDERWAHPRVSRAVEHRRDVRVLADDSGVVTLGRGLVGRLEVSVERTDDGRNGPGRGRRLITAAVQLAAATTDERWCWAQVSPGNAKSLRSFLAAGFVPICSEQLLLPAHAAR